MPQITYVAADSTERTLDVSAGLSVMRGAVMNDVDGIAAQCGGSAQCATCHVYVDPKAVAALEEMDEEEDDMLGYTACERRPNSRLSCRLQVTDALDGLVVHLPERQY
ncbi:2Fe-2S iron-sulfur cluster-binding protein [Streptacidiphilus carbonis]|jgi:ferredoxin, 2Fe-2S|uniref:2Fe-2S iron-sulfur cluster-binding protein n=1 Tax=Streptacidiphilus carbonis TaxID=105422 RepID=UPI0005A8FFD2|nr:2Fe-2S iron-sulfur cluster-binding protein [Streptacidiphilus carbonis]